MPASVTNPPVPYATQAQTIRDNLVQELANESARRMTLTAQGNPPPATYSVGGKTVDWTGYVTAMQALIAAQNKEVIAAGGDGGLYETVTRGY